MYAPKPAAEVVVVVCPTCGTETVEGNQFLRPCCIAAVTTPDLDVDVARFHDDGGLAHPELD